MELIFLKTKKKWLHEIFLFLRLTNKLFLSFYTLPCNIFTTTILVEFSSLSIVSWVDGPCGIHEGVIMTPLYTLPKSQWPSSSHIKTSSRFISHFLFASSSLLTSLSLYSLCVGQNTDAWVGKQSGSSGFVSALVVLLVLPPQQQKLQIPIRLG